MTGARGKKTDGQVGPAKAGGELPEDGIEQEARGGDGAAAFDRLRWSGGILNTKGMAPLAPQAPEHEGLILLVMVTSGCLDLG